MLAQILCARLKILAMPLVHMGGGLALPPAAAAEGPAGDGAPAADAAAPLPAPAGEGEGEGAAGGEEEEAGAPRRRRRRRAGGGGGLGGVPRDHFAPNILKGYWELRPEQRWLMPRLRCAVCAVCVPGFRGVFLLLGWACGTKQKVAQARPQVRRLRGVRTWLPGCVSAVGVGLRHKAEGGSGPASGAPRRG